VIVIVALSPVWEIAGLATASDTVKHFANFRKLSVNNRSQRAIFLSKVPFKTSLSQLTCHHHPPCGCESQ
jgi:hypothetical protein